jgi:hypothetical protein
VPISKTLTEYQAKVESLASIKGQVGSGNTFRHPSDDILDTLNSSYAEYRELLVSWKFDFFLEETTQAALPTSRADTNEQYALIDWPATAISIRRVDVYQRSEWKALSEVEWGRIRDVVPSAGPATSSRFRFFSAKSHGAPSTTTVTTGKLAIFPFSNASGVYKVSYLPRHTPVATGSHVFVFASESGYMWAVWNAVAQLSIRDRDQGKRHAPSLVERARREKEIGFSSANTIATGGLQMRRSPGYNG